MTILPLIAFAAQLASLAPNAPAPEAAARRRFALVVGANDGGRSKQLRHAVSDARAFAKVMESLGGVRPVDAIFLQDPDPAELQRGLIALREKVEGQRATLGQSELVFYYSGHSDESGLWLKGLRFPYSELHRALDAVRPEFSIAVLDSCQSGTFARAKGGTWVAPFLADRATSVHGQATLTSSSATEVSQESDRIGGSFFTHNLISGLRGAADVSRDGRVTLGEAYQFAFNETMARTQNTVAGAQHPAYEMALAGTGDVVLTDLHGTAAVLSLPVAEEGRFFIRDGEGRLVAELNKRAGAPIDLGLEEGTYTVAVVRNKKWSSATIAVRSGKAIPLDPAAFQAAAAEAYAVRGVEGGEVEDLVRAQPPKAWRAGVGLDLAAHLIQPTTVGYVDLDFTYYLNPLIDDEAYPLAFLGFVQHPNRLDLSLTSLGVTVYPWARTGLSGSLGLYWSPRPFQVAGGTYSLGIIQYLGRSLRLSATYAGSQGSSAPSDWLENMPPNLTLSSSTMNSANVEASLLVADRLLLSLRASAGEMRSFNRHVDSNGVSETQGNTLTIAGGLGGTLSLSRRLSVSLFVSSGLDRSAYEGDTYRSAHYSVSPGIQYFFADWLSLDGAYTFYQDFSGRWIGGLSSHQVRGGASARF